MVYTRPSTSKSSSPLSYPLVILSKALIAISIKFSTEKSKMTRIIPDFPKYSV